MSYINCKDLFWLEIRNCLQCLMHRPKYDICLSCTDSISCLYVWYMIYGSLPRPEEEGSVSDNDHLMEWWVTVSWYNHFTLKKTHPMTDSSKQSDDTLTPYPVRWNCTHCLFVCLFCWCVQQHLILHLDNTQCYK